MNASAGVVRQPPRLKTWSPDRIAELRKLWGAGEAASAIAPKLRCGVDAVRAKVDELGLTRAPTDRKAVANNVAMMRRVHAKKIITGTGAVMEASTDSKDLGVPFRDVPATAKTIVDLALDECRMPVGDLLADHGHATLFCGATTRRDRILPNGQVGFQSYCPCHLREATKLLPGGVRPSEKQLRHDLRRVL